MKLKIRIIDNWLFINTGYCQLITKGLDYKLDDEDWSNVLSIYQRI